MSPSISWRRFAPPRPRLDTAALIARGLVLAPFWFCAAVVAAIAYTFSKDPEDT